MQPINSSVSFSTLAARPAQSKGTLASANKDVRPIEQSLDKAKQEAERVKIPLASDKQSIELDDAALAFLEANDLTSGNKAHNDFATGLAPNSNPIPTSQELSANDSSNQSAEQLAKEQIPLHNQSAVSSYQMIGNLAQRESVQQMLGVDVFA